VQKIDKEKRMLKSSASLCLGLAVFALVLSSSVFANNNEDETQKKESAKLSYKTYSKWIILLPKETFSPAAGRIAIGQGFPTQAAGPALAVDTNGDGKVDEKAKGTAANLILKGKRDDGSKYKYAVRMVNSGGWKWASSGAMAGTVKGTPVRLIDQNNNGIYNEFGVDAMIVGKGNVATFLSRIVSLGGDLYNLEVNANGDEVFTTPFEGETGVLNLRADYNTKGKLEAAVVVNENGDVSFDLAKAKKGMKVPTGAYVIASGKISKGRESAIIARGTSKPIRVHKDEPSVFAWGGPIRAEFSFDRNGKDVTFSPQQLWFYGKGGEEYKTWIPDGKPPKFIIKNKANGRELETATFGGC
jgi:hypothetical protein